MNPYESGERKNIPAVLIYVEAEDRILMIHRNSKDRPGDYHAGRWNGLGGKCEGDESYLEAAARELEEESGLKLTGDRFVALGLIQFPNFKPARSEDWTVMVFSALVSSQDAEIAGLAISKDLETAISKGVEKEEGSLHWVKREEILKLRLWEGDRHFIPSVLERKKFYGAIWYDGAEVRRHDIRSF